MGRKAGSKDTGSPAPQADVEEHTAPVVVAAAAPPAPLSTEEYREALYRRLMANHRAVDAKLAEIDSGRKVIAKGRTQIRSQLTQAGYSLENVDNVLKDTNKTRDNRAKQQGRVDQLAWMREMEGLPNPKTGEQIELELRLPDTERDGIAWEQAGYNSGVIDEPCDIPAACPPIFHQRWTNFWHQGQERRKWAMAQDVNPDRDMSKAGDVALKPVEHCTGCGGDGSALAADVTVCPVCDAEYEPEELAAAETVDDPGAAFADLDDEITDDKIDSAFNGDETAAEASELVH